MTLFGVVVNGVIRLEKDQTLPEGTRVKVTVAAEGEPADSLQNLMVEFAGCMTDLPPDLAEQHDHYVHGMPKR
jgi:hypothetical protein